MHPTPSPPLMYRNILVLVDLNNIPDRLIDYLKALSSTWPGRYWLIHVAPPDPEFVGYEVGPDTVRDQVARELREEHRRLQTLADNLRALRIDTAALLVQGPTTEKILDEVDRLSIDLIVAGVRRHGTLQRVFSGSIVADFIERSPCPILLVPIH